MVRDASAHMMSQTAVAINSNMDVFNCDPISVPNLNATKIWRSTAKCNIRRRRTIQRLNSYICTLSRFYSEVVQTAQNNKAVVRTSTDFNGPAGFLFLLVNQVNSFLNAVYTVSRCNRDGFSISGKFHRQRAGRNQTNQHHQRQKSAEQPFRPLCFHCFHPFSDKIKKCILPIDKRPLAYSLRGIGPLRPKTRRTTSIPSPRKRQGMLPGVFGGIPVGSNRPFINIIHIIAS